MQGRRVKRGSRGFSLIELLIVIAIILILIGAAVPYYDKVQMGARETAVIQDLQTIYKAQVQYKTLYGKYANTLVQLAPPVSGNTSPEASGLMSANLASGEKESYLFVMTGSEDSFTVNAKPKVFGSSGRRTFYLDQGGTIHQNPTNEAATASSPELK